LHKMKVLSALFALTGVVNAFTNPPFWQDLADLDIRRVDDAYYYSASTMHYSPGAPILRSYDLFNWEYIGHSVPSLATFGSKYTLTNGQRAYVNGIWASWFNYASAKKTWFWGGCIDFQKTYIFSASSVTGPWSLYATLNTCHYDSGSLIDDDGTMYISYSSNNQIWVAQLASDYKSVVKSQMVFNPPSNIGYLEGTRMYKRSGKYYILATHPASAEWTLQASSPFGSYSSKVLANGVKPPISGAGNPHQGGLIDTPNGNWYYMAFIDAYPSGRTPVLAPVTWGSDGFPTLQLSNGGWGSSYSDPLTAHPLGSQTGVDFFQGSALGPQWEWNHDPDNTAWSLNNGLVLKTTSPVTVDLYSARNTLTHRMLGPTSTATIKLLYGNMKDGDRAGLAMFRDSSAWIGVKRDNGATTVGMTNGLAMGGGWTTINTGSTVASQSISGGTIWLRVVANLAPSGSKNAQFSYSTDGSKFNNLGPAYGFNTTWNFFLGYRAGIFNYATSSTGGSVTVQEFQLDTGSGTAPSPVPGGGSSTTATSSTGTTTTSSTTTTTTTTSTSTTSAPTGGSCSALYGQCGGSGYSGPTCCSSGTCKYSNDWYSQCL